MRVKRPLCIASAAVLLTALPAFVNSAPLSGVAPTDWAAHSVASLASRGIIRGYPDGLFHGDRLATRNEMAAVVSRVLAQAEAEAAPKSDLDRTGQLIDALKDEVDALSMRVSRLEERLRMPQEQSFGQQPAIRRARRAESASASRTAARLSKPITRNEVAVLADGALRELGARDASKNDLENAHRRIGAVSDRLDLLSARIARFDPLPSEEHLEPMVRIRRGGPLVEVFDESALRWARLEQTVQGSVAGIAFHPVEEIATPARFSLIGQAIFGVKSIATLPPELAVQTIANPQVALSLNRYLPKSFPVIAFSAPLGTPLELPNVTKPASFGSALLSSGVPRLNAPNGSADAQISVPAATIALPALGRSTPFSVPTIGSQAYGSNGQPVAPLNVPQLRVNFTIPARLGDIATRNNFGLAHLQGLDRNGSTQSCSILPALCAAAFGSGSFATQLTASSGFDVRALGRNVSLNFGGSYEQLHRPAGTALPYVPYDPATDNRDSTLMNFTPMTFDPNYVDVLKRTLNAAAAVPLAHDLTLNLQYDKEYYTTSYQSFGQNIDERRDSYLGNLTYTFPNTSSTIVVSAKQYRYRDAFLPTYNQTQDRADLNFTIKF